MDTKKVLYLVEMLRNSSQGKEKELSEIYQRAIYESDEYENLKNTLDSCVYYGVSGENMLEDGNKLLNRLLAGTDDIFRLLQEIHQFNDMVENDVINNEWKMQNPGAFVDEINIVKRDNIYKYCVFLEQVASIITYTIACEKGYSGLEKLFWPQNGGLTERLHNVNNSFIPNLLALPEQRAPWIICRKTNNHSIRFYPYEYYLQYVPTEVYYSWIQRGDYQEMGPKVYGNLHFFQEMIVDMPIYCGIGNIVSTDPMNSLPLLSSGVVTTPATPNESMVADPLPFLPEMLKKISYNSASIFTPETIVSVMNQWNVGHIVRENKRNRKCLICGEPLMEGRKICRNHFQMTRGNS